MKTLNQEKSKSDPNFSFHKIEFVGSFVSVDSLPNKPYPELVMIGKSNVGKSSLINHLTSHKIAKISQKPGKTQTLNLYEVDEKLYLMDLPGYGYAKVPQSIKKTWQNLIENYFLQRKNLQLGICLFDSRHPFTSKDLETLQWVQTLLIPIIFVFTKMDKLSSPELKKMEKYFEKFLKEMELSEYPKIFYSIQKAQCRKHLIKTINSLIYASS